MKKAPLVLLLLALVGSLFVLGAARKTLDIYFIDVEGGAATLIVTPAGQSVLVDSGWKREDRRDALRIAKAVKAAGLTQIDHVVTTHFHDDHFGGLAALSELIPIGNYYDHGRVEGLKSDRRFAAMYPDYLKATGGRQKQLRPGDRIPLESKGKVPLAFVCVSAGRETLAAGPKSAANRSCENLAAQPDDPSDNAASVGLLLRYGAFEFLDLGDLTDAVMAKLVCPANVLGQVDVYQVTHHGNRTSSLPQLGEGIQPTVAVINNGPKKGGHVEAFTMLKSIGSISAIFQLHRNLDTAEWDNTQPPWISNLGPEENCAGHGVRVSVDEKAKFFTVINERPDSGLAPVRYRVK